MPAVVLNNTSLPIFDKFELRKNYITQQAREDGNTVNRKDYTKKVAARAVSNPCSYDYNMRSHGAPSYVKNQLTFTGGIASFIGDPAPTYDFRTQRPSSARVGSAQTYVGGLFNKKRLESGGIANLNAAEDGFRPVTADASFANLRKSANVNSSALQPDLGKFSDRTLRETSKKLQEKDGFTKVVTSGRPLNEQLNKKVSYSSNMCNTSHTKALKDQAKGFKNATSFEKSKLEENVTKQVTDILQKTKGDPMHLQSGNADIKDMVKDAVKEYFDSLNLPQLVTDTNKQQMPTEFKGYNEEGEEVWAVVRKDPMAELLNTNASRPSSRMATMRAPPNGLQRSKTQYWNDDIDFQNNLQSWASTAPNHEREIVRNLLKRLNGGQTPAEMSSTQQQQLPLNTDRSLRTSGLGVSGHFEPIQYQCDLSMFTKPPYNPSRHFTINPEWSSERYTVKRIPAAHLHPSATLKNKLGLLRS
ncbi:uncharacterized protein LOC142336354 [Convolutriloba macropyga]|uniref:uncharacterized protein LOC142336354 n=1 Tax=Convolutriloba macropyga TaxID=536237 RepID=UPI003F52601B